MTRLATMQANAVRAQREVLASEEKLLADVTAIAQRVRRHRMVIAGASGFASGMLAGLAPARVWKRASRIAFAAIRTLSVPAARMVVRAMKARNSN